MAVAKIKSPIWNGRDPKKIAIGIADFRLMNSTHIQADILYRDKDGMKVFDHKYTMRCDIARSYPLKYEKGTPIRIIPLNDFMVDGVPNPDSRETVVIDEAGG